MKEALLQVQHGTHDFLLADEDDDVLRNFKHNQKVRVTIHGVQKERSYDQLKAWWGVCEYCRLFMGINRLNTKKKMSKYVLIKTGHVEFAFPVNGILHMEAKSISYANMEHLEACGAINDGLGFMCVDMMGSTVEAIIEELKQNGKYKGEWKP